MQIFWAHALNARPKKVHVNHLSQKTANGEGGRCQKATNWQEHYFLNLHIFL